MRRDNRQERREDRGPSGGEGGGKSHYQMREKMVSIGDDFWIENDRGEKVYKVDGKALRVRQTLIIEDTNRTASWPKSRRRCCGSRTRWRSKARSGERIAMVKKALITPVRERWTVNVKGGPDLEVQGNILDHEYTIGEGRDQVAEVSKKWFRLRDTYGVEIDAGQDDALILAVTVCIDQMGQPNDNRFTGNSDELAEAYVHCPGEFVLRLTGLHLAENTVASVATVDLPPEKNARGHDRVAGKDKSATRTEMATIRNAAYIPRATPCGK